MFPTWTAYTRGAGLLLTAVFVVLGLSETVQTLGTAVRSVAFAAMGVVCLRIPERIAGDRARSETWLYVQPDL